MFPHVADDVVGYDGFPRPWLNLAGRQVTLRVNSVPLMATASCSLAMTPWMRRRRYCQPCARAVGSSGVT